MKYRLDTEGVPDDLLTSEYSAEFCELVGRVVMSFGALEHALYKTCCLLLALRHHRKFCGKFDRIYIAFERRYYQRLAESLGRLIAWYVEICGTNEDIEHCITAKVEKECNKLKDYRNVFCHAYWPPPVDGKVIPLFMRSKDYQFFGNVIDIESLYKLQKSIQEVFAEVYSTIIRLLDLPEIA